MLFGDETKIHTRNAREVKIALLWWGTGEARCSCFCCCCLLNTNLGKVLNDHFVHAAASYIDCAAFEHCSIYMLIVVIRRNEWIEYEANMFEISELEDDGSSLRSFFFLFYRRIHNWCAPLMNHAIDNMLIYESNGFELIHTFHVGACMFSHTKWTSNLQKWALILAFFSLLSLTIICLLSI